MFCSTVCISKIADFASWKDKNNCSVMLLSPGTQLRQRLIVRSLCHDLRDIP